MGNVAAESPASYVLATQFHESVREILDALSPDHDHLALELLKYSERIMGNVGAAEAPFARDRRQVHYRIAFGAICGCAAACDLVYRLELAPKELAGRARQLLGSLAVTIRPIAEEGMPPRTDEEEAVIDGILGPLTDDDADRWSDDRSDDDDEAW